MALICYPVPHKEKSRLICRAFENGAPRSAKGSVFFGTEGVMDAYQRALVRAKEGREPFWYIDNAYTDPHRGTYFRVTKNALQVDVRPSLGALMSQPPGDTGPIVDGWLRSSTGERARAQGIKVKPWRQVDPHGRILVIPQSDDFMKSTLGRKGNWTAEAVKRLAEFGVPSHEIRVRPWLRDKKTAYVELHQELPSARLVVTWSSASAITALLDGVPAISESGAASWMTGPLSSANVRDPVSPQCRRDDMRQRFADILADNQFTLDEFRDGTAWRWLERSR